MVSTTSVESNCRYGLFSFVAGSKWQSLVLCRQLNKMMAQLDLMKALFERAGGAKHGADMATPTRRKRSSASVSWTSPLVCLFVCCCCWWCCLLPSVALSAGLWL